MKMKKMVVIVKTSQADFVKYHTTDLLSFTKFLDNKYPDWRYFNVYDKESRLQVGNYTKNNRPAQKHLL